MKRPQDIPHIVDLLSWLAWLAAVLGAMATAADTFKRARGYEPEPRERTPAAARRPDLEAYADAMNTESDPDMAEAVVGDPEVVLVGEAARVHGAEHTRLGGGSARRNAAAAAVAPVKGARK